MNDKIAVRNKREERHCIKKWIKKQNSEDYWNLPEKERSELIHGKLYAMVPLGRIHQKSVSKLNTKIDNYITDKKSPCEVYLAPFAVNLEADEVKKAERRYVYGNLCKSRECCI